MNAIEREWNEIAARLPDLRTNDCVIAVLPSGRESVLKERERAPLGIAESYHTERVPVSSEDLVERLRKALAEG